MKRTYVKGKAVFAIDHDRTTVTITEGTPGKTKVWKYKSADKAHASWSEKLAKAIAAGFKPPKPREVTNPELEAAILAAPDDDDAYSVYADWLQAQDQPRGQLAATQAAIAKLPKGKPADQHYYTSDSAVREVWFDASRAKGAKALFDRQAALFADHALNPADYDLAEYTQNNDGGTQRSGARFHWRHGFVRAAWFELGGAGAEGLAAVTHAVGHPSCRFLRSLTLGQLYDSGYGTKALTAIAKVTPKTLRFLHLGDFGIGSPEISWVDVGDVSPFYKATPDLEMLVIQGAGIQLGAKVDLPKLRRLEIRTGGLPAKTARAIAASKLPALETLIVWFGDRDYKATTKLADITPLLAGKGIPKLTHLALANCEFANELAAAIVKSKIVKQLRTLDLSRSALDDDGARILADGKQALSHLETLDVSDSNLTPAGVKLLKGVAQTVLAGDQREPYDWDEDKRRYVSVGE
ncbi:MAG: TIGR02996 domain-containing protein [Deltaproteobacteria bacterium]|nr:TIGR02996 domain-containing protein [Deltaproteobacteria bacterium]